MRTLILLNSKKHLAILSLCASLLLIHFTAAAQEQLKLTGTVLSQKDALPYVTIAVLRDSTVLKGVLSNDSGKFIVKLQKGHYILKVTAIGYKPFSTQIDLEQGLRMDIQLTVDRQSLSEVKIVATKPLIEQRVDRLVFNVQNSIFSTGLNGMDLLSETPKVEVTDEGVIKLLGKSNLSVMIDGRLLQGDEVKERLSSLRSDNIASIEVITTPPAKYSAEGNSGLINIILKKNPSVGWLFNVSTAYKQRTFSGIDPAINASYKNDKIDFSFGTSGFIEKKRYTSDNQYQALDFFWDKSTTRDATSKNLSFNTSLNYKINKKTNIGFLADFSLESDHESAFTNSLFENATRTHIDSSIYSPTPVKNKYNFGSIDVYYEYNIDSSGKKLTITGDYFRKGLNNDRDLTSIITSTNPRSESIDDYGTSQYHGSSLNVDLELPFKLLKIETGAAVTFINNHAYDTTSFNNASATFDDFYYKETTTAAYASATKDFNKKWSAQAGLRFENLYLSGNSITLNQQNSATYNELFPTGYLLFNATADESISLTYSRRIEKPYFFYLNPYRTYIDDYTYSSGNPYLLPSFSNNIELSQTYKNNFTTTLSGSLITNGIDYVTSFEPNSAITIAMPENYIKEYNISLAVSYSLPLKWVNSYNSLTGSYVQTSSDNSLVDISSSKGFGGYYSMRNTLPINRKRKIFFVLNYLQRFPSADDFFKYRSRSNVDMGLRFKALKGKLQSNVLITDVFKTNYTNGYINYPNVQQSIKNYNDNRALTISLSYTFGNQRAAIDQKQLDNSEKNRAMF